MPELIPQRVSVANVTNIANVTEGFAIGNFTQYDFITALINEKKFLITENYITPDYAGITVNNDRYDIFPNESLLLASTSEYLYYMRLTRIAIVPALDTINFSIFAVPNLTSNEVLSYATNASINMSLTGNGISYINLENLNTLISIESPESTGLSLTVTNLTGSNDLPIPTGYDKWLLMNISAKALTDSATLSMNVTSVYDCNSSPDVTAPYLFNGGNWVALDGVNYNSTSCQMSFGLSRSGIVGIFEKSSKPITATTSQTSSQTSAQFTPPIFSYGGMALTYCLLAIIAMAATILLYRYARKQ